MKEITVLSGKGGTGKTSITAALASVAKNAIFCDNDVDAADLHLLLHPEIRETHNFSSGSTAHINVALCSNCGLCQRLCRFDAIHFNENNNLEVNPFQCEGCRLCERVCPTSAITSTENLNNFWYVSDTRFGTTVHAYMGPGEENSGKLVSKIRKKAKELAIENKADFIINDGPPGIGCAAISSVSGTDLVLLVIEPTKSGLHDVERLLELINSFKIKAVAVINKCDINEEVTAEVEAFLLENNIKLLEKIPFNKVMVEALIEGKTIVEYQPESAIAKQIIKVWEYLNQ